VHFFDPHQWEWAVARRPGETPASRYGRAVEQTLGDAGRLLEGMDRALAARPTITLLSADPGEALGDRQFRHHTRFLYDFLVHVPLLIRGPGIPAGDVTVPVSLLDVMPTILDLAGVGPCADCSGDSLTRLIGTATVPPRRPVLLRDNGQVALILDGWKLLFAPRYGWLELYRLDDERPDAEMSSRHADVAREMLGLLRLSPLRHLPPLRVP
jgi:arylsulfatase A-like enzyme